jgi:pimeloyl-ACP methyl ester carboxylesterase
VKVYFIPGLGADKRVFKNIQLPEGFQPFYLDWIPPCKQESLSSYALRMAEQIPADNDDFALVGLSFGGMLAVEIARIKHPCRLVLLSSIASSEELPGYYRFASRFKLQDLVPVSFFKSAAILKRLFTAETPEEKDMLRQMIRDVEPSFIHWALNAILQWESTTLPENYIHIHGTGDELIPLKYTHASHIIKRGGHLMVMNRAEEINTILCKVLDQAEVSN